MSDAPAGPRLVRTGEDTARVDAFVAAHGGRVGLGGVVRDLDRHARRALAPGLAVHRALTWERADRHDPTWWPQGITTSADGCADERLDGRRVVLVSWYARGRPGVRISVLDPDSRRYAHVRVVVLDRAGHDSDLRAHAGGIVWHGEWLHVAATARGLFTCRLDDVVRLPEPVDGCRFALPVRCAYRAQTAADQEPLRYSFLSLDRASDPPHLTVGEYGRGRQTRRLARFPVDPETQLLVADADGVSHPVLARGDGPSNAQGVVLARDRWYLTSSRGSRLGSVYAGQPGALRRFRWATPMGPEDLSWWPSTDLLWSVTEHPGRRWIFTMRRSRFDRAP